MSSSAKLLDAAVVRNMSTDALANCLIVSFIYFEEDEWPEVVLACELADREKTRRALSLIADKNEYLAIASWCDYVLDADADHLGGCGS